MHKINKILNIIYLLHAKVHKKLTSLAKLLIDTFSSKKNREYYS